MAKPTTAEEVSLRHHREVVFRKAVLKYEKDSGTLDLVRLDTLVRHWQGDIDTARDCLIADVERLEGEKAEAIALLRDTRDAVARLLDIKNPDQEAFMAAWGAATLNLEGVRGRIDAYLLSRSEG